MSKLEELIAELCPDGVEYVQLREVFELTQHSQDLENRKSLS